MTAVITVVAEKPQPQIGKMSAPLLTYPGPVTVIELAEYVREVVFEETGGKLNPSVCWKVFIGR